MRRSERWPLSRFDVPPARAHRLSDVLDTLNARSGEFGMTPPSMIGLDNRMLGRMAFGRVKALAALARSADTSQASPRSGYLRSRLSVGFGAFTAVVGCAGGADRPA